MSISLPTITADYHSRRNSFPPSTPKATGNPPPNSQTTPDFVQVHASSSTVPPYPDTSHKKKGQEKTRSTSSALHQEGKQSARECQGVSSDDQDDISSPHKSLRDKLKDINEKIRSTENRLDRAQFTDGKKKLAKNLEKELGELKSEKAQLKKIISPNTEQSESTSSNKKSSASESVTASGENTLEQFEVPDALSSINSLLMDHQKEMAALTKTLHNLRHTPGNQAKISLLMTQLAVIQNGIDSLKYAHKRLSGKDENEPLDINVGPSSTASTSPQRADDGKTKKNIKLSELVRTKTTRHPPSTSSPPEPPKKNRGKDNEKDSSEVITDDSSEVVGECSIEDSREDSREDTSSLSEIHENYRNSTLLMSEDLKKILSQKGRKAVDKIDLKIDNAANEADMMTFSAARLESQIKHMRNGGSSNKDELRRKEKILNEVKAKQLKCFIKFGELLLARDKLEEKELLETPQPTPKEKEDAYKALLESVKSQKTRALEKTHVDILAELERTTSTSPVSTSVYTVLAGAAAFSVSFLIANTLSRFVPSPLIAISWVGAPIVAGTLHVITATPMAKQVMTRAWTSNAMAELNNNFKLRGFAWGDSWGGKSDELKYVSKDPTKTKKITITEKLKEEKPFQSLLGERFKTEEAAYFTYTMNYTFKAIAAAFLTSYLKDGNLASKGVEATLHGFCGALSGAEYLWLQQENRSKHPNAKQNAVPTRECYAAEVAALESLREDLQAKITEYRNQHNKDPKDKTESNLYKALRKNEKALIIAALRSKPLGTLRHEFWAQFSKAAWRDTLSEILGRILSLAPTAVVSELTRSWRASPDPYLMFLGHALPAVVLIAPPGFTARPLYSGAIRGLLEAFESSREKKTVATRKQNLQSVADEDSEVVTSSISESQRISFEDSDESVVVSVESDFDDSDDESWDGNPTDRDLHQGL